MANEQEGQGREVVDLIFGNDKFSKEKLVGVKQGRKYCEGQKNYWFLQIAYQFLVSCAVNTKYIIKINEQTIRICFTSADPNCQKVIAK